MIGSTEPMAMHPVTLSLRMGALLGVRSYGRQRVAASAKNVSYARCG